MGFFIKHKITKKETEVSYGDWGSMQKKPPFSNNFDFYTKDEAQSLAGVPFSDVTDSEVKPEKAARKPKKE